MTHRDLHQRLREGALDEHLGLLVAVLNDFASSVDLDETLHHTTERMMAFLDAEAASVFLVEADGWLVCRASGGASDVTGLRVPPAQGIVGRTVREGRVCMVRDVHRDPDFFAQVDADTGFVTRSILSAPLSIDGECLGALELINKRGGDGLFDERDRAALSALAAAAALAIRNARMTAARVEQERLRRELELAREIQRHLLPETDGPGQAVSGVNIPAREVSGDFFDYFPLPDGRIAFTIADVAGKGVDAALLTARTGSLLRCLAQDLDSPGRLLARVNVELCEATSRGKFITAVAGVYDPASGAVTLANAGHLPALLRDAEGHYTEFPAGAPPLGILPDLEFPEAHLNLAAGSLYLFTDGVTEARGADGQALGMGGLTGLIDAQRAAEPEADPLQGLRRLAAAVAGGRGPLHDDLTLLLVQYPRPAAASPLA